MVDGSEYYAQVVVMPPSSCPLLPTGPVLGLMAPGGDEGHSVSTSACELCERGPRAAGS